MAKKEKLYSLDENGVLTIAPGVTVITALDVAQFTARDIKEVVIPDGVLEIEDGVFDYTSIKSVEIPDSVTRMYGSFVCSAIENVKLPKGLKHVGGFRRTNIKTIEIPDGVESIGFNSFKECKKIESVKLPTGLKYIRDNAFEGCSELKDIELPEGLEVIGQEAFKNCTSLESVVIPKGVKLLVSGPTFHDYSSVFEGCSSLKNVVIEEGVEEMEGTFMDCTSLESIVVPKSVKKLDTVFMGCTALKNVTLTEGLEEIVYDVFKGCVALESITIPNSVKKIYLSAFSGTGIKELTIPADVELDCRSTCKMDADIKLENERYTFDGVKLIDNQENEVVYVKSGAKNVKIEDGLKLKEHVLGGCSSMETLDLGKDAGNEVFLDGCVSLKRIRAAKSVRIMSLPKDVVLEEIDRYDDGTGTDNTESDFIMLGQKEQVIKSEVLEFDGKDAENIEISDGGKKVRGCRNRLSLKTVVIPDGVEEIDYFAFRECQNLESVVLPKSVKTIGGYAFEGCESLKSIELNDGLEAIGENAFKGCMALKEVRIPASVKRLGIAQSTYWMKNLDADLIVECAGYRFENGTLIDEGKSEIIYIKESLKDLVVPKDVKKIRYIVGSHPKFESVTLLNPNVKCDEFPLVDDGVIYVACTPAAMAKLKINNKNHWGWTNGVMRVMKK